MVAVCNRLVPWSCSAVSRLFVACLKMPHVYCGMLITSAVSGSREVTKEL